MTVINQAPRELSKLAIDRTTQVKTTGLPVNLSGLIIITLLGSSIFFVGQHFFPSITSAQTYELDETEVTTLNKLNKANVKPIQLSEKSLVSTPSSTEQTALDASGHIVARRIATVSSQITGKLNLLNIEEGQEVKQSDILAELDDKQATIAYQLALAELSSKQASYDEFTLLFKQQTQRFSRNKSLASQQLISQQLLEDSEFRNAQLSIQIRNKQSLVHIAEQRVELAQYQLNQHKIRAPFDGVVISKNAQVGELISAGSSGGGFIRTGVGTIVDMSSLEIEVEVGESYINRVHAGQKVIAKLDAYPQWKINSEVVAVIPTADRQKASIKVRVKLLITDPRILPDMGVKVSFMNTAGNSHNKTEIAAL
jgi:RND family efflux transporter MFP subunit